MIKLNQTAIKSMRIAAALVLGAFSLSAHAALTSYTAQGGKDVVYSSVSDVTWTKDANLLGSMIASQGFNTVVNNILTASPTISNTPNTLSPSGSYTLTSTDFSSNGQVSWFGAMAFVSYLNSTNYAGSNQWRLPTVVNTRNTAAGPTNGTTAGDELRELFFNELGGVRSAPMPNTATFDNEQIAFGHWSGTEGGLSERARYLETDYGTMNQAAKNNLLFAWAVSPGQVAAAPSAVPVPAAAWLFGSGLVGLAGLRRCKQQA